MISNYMDVPINNYHTLITDGKTFIEFSNSSIYRYLPNLFLNSVAVTFMAISHALAILVK